jgi:hypothetical protein
MKWDEALIASQKRCGKTEEIEKQRLRAQYQTRNVLNSKKSG